MQPKANTAFRLLAPDLRLQTPGFIPTNSLYSCGPGSTTPPGSTRALLRRLGELWDITVIDPDAERLEIAGRVRAIDAVVGDGSSRVVLERVGIDEADALVAATNDDEVNLEVCRIARRAGLVRVVAIAADPEYLPDYRDAAVPAFAPDSLAARQVELSLEPRRVTSTAFAHV